MSIELVTPSNHLILYHSLLLLPSIFPSIRVFSNESALHIRWPKYWEFQLQHQSFQWTPRTCLKETINKAKIQPSEWETMFANEAADEGLTSKADKQLSSPNFRLSGERLTQVAHLWFSSLRRPWSVSGLVWAALLTVGQAQLAPVMQTHRRLFLRKQTSCCPGEEPLAGLSWQGGFQSPAVNPRWKAPAEEADVFYAQATRGRLHDDWVAHLRNMLISQVTIDPVVKGPPCTWSLMYVVVTKPKNHLGSFVHFAISASWNGSCAQSLQTCLTLCDPMSPTRLLCPWNSPGKKNGVGCHALL